jgi:hypothetical protein
MAAERESPTPAEQVARLYEQAETQAAQASESLVGSGGFASLLGQVAENTAALTKLTSDWMDLVWRNLRVAGRRDIVRLSRQLGRTDDKLERVLQELEEVRDQLADGETRRSPPRRNTRTGGGNGSPAPEQKGST